MTNSGENPFCRFRRVTHSVFYPVDPSVSLSMREPRFGGLQFAEWVEIEDVGEAALSLIQPYELVAGETSALALALEHNRCGVLMDEHNGRMAAADLGLTANGLVGILVRARQRGSISTLKPLLHRLTDEAQFWIGSRLRQRVLTRVGEADA